jgi:hypothetical protein
MPLQLANPALHAAMTHTPAEHAAAALGKTHTLPHAPQLLVLVMVLVSQPSAALLLQSAQPALHDPIPHTPPIHAATPLAIGAHIWPHEPQLLTVVNTLTSQPSAMIPLQSAKPTLQVILQTPLTQKATAFGNEHTLPQDPQLFTSVLTFTSHPSLMMLLQSK